MGIAVLVAFALLNPDQPPGTLDMPGLEANGFTDPQSRAVDGHQQRPVFGIVGEGDQAESFLDGERVRKFLLFTPGGNREGPIRSFKDSCVQKTEGGKCNVAGVPGEFSFLDQIEQIALDLVLGQLIGGLHIEFCQTGDRGDVGCFCFLSQITQSHLIEHQGTKWGVHYYLLG